MSKQITEAIGSTHLYDDNISDLILAYAMPSQEDVEPVKYHHHKMWFYYCLYFSSLREREIELLFKHFDEDSELIDRLQLELDMTTEYLEKLVLSPYGIKQETTESSLLTAKDMEKYYRKYIDHRRQYKELREVIDEWSSTICKENDCAHNTVTVKRRNITHTLCVN